jgi:hypothetical protein
MNKRPQSHKPRARKEGLLLQELRDEVIIYDLDSNKAHCLNPTAALVWKHCNGRTTVKEIARHLENTLGTTVDEDLADIVWCALTQLEKDHLLEEKIAWPVGMPGMSRRELVRRLGIGAVVVIPVVTSLLVPSVAFAGSTCNTGASCRSLADCAATCSGCQNIDPNTGIGTCF